MARAVCTGGAALSQTGEPAATGGNGAHAADLLFAAVVQPIGPGGRRVAVRLGGDAPVRGGDLGCAPVPELLRTLIALEAPRLLRCCSDSILESKLSGLSPSNGQGVSKGDNSRMESNRASDLSASIHNSPPLVTV